MTQISRRTARFSVADDPRNTPKPKPKPMSLTSAAAVAASTVNPFVLVLLVVPSVAVVLQHPDSRDLYAVFGAMFATFVAHLESAKRQRGFKHALSVMAGAALAGMALPGMTLYEMARHGWIPLETVQTLSWHYWAIFGAIAGTVGWGIMHSVALALKRVVVAKLSRIAQEDYEMPHRPVVKPDPPNNES